MTTSTAPLLLAYDGSDDAEAALVWASREAAMRGLRLRVVMVDDVSVAPWGEHTWVEDNVDLAHAELVMKEAGVVDGTTERRSGFVVPTLLELAPHASMVVVGSRGHGRVSELAVGSVGRHLAAHATRPVVAVRPPVSVRAERIVVGLDGSETSAAAFEFACDRAELTGESVTALHGWKVRPRPSGFGGQTPSIAEMVDDRELLLAESIAGVRAAHPDVVVVTEAVPVAPARALIDASSNASLVVVGSRGRGVFAGMLLGSVGQDVLHRAHCPVAVVR